LISINTVHVSLAPSLSNNQSINIFIRDKVQREKEVKKKAIDLHMLMLSCSSVYFSGSSVRRRLTLIGMNTSQKRLISTRDVGLCIQRSRRHNRQTRKNFGLAAKDFAAGLASCK